MNGVLQAADPVPQLPGGIVSKFFDAYNEQIVLMRAACHLFELFGHLNVCSRQTAG
jgi:hypothetical protein